MWSFEGDFRSKPIQSLRGASKQEHKDCLLKRIQDERLQRQQYRLEDSSARKIQHAFRRFQRQSSEIHVLQKNFDEILRAAAKNSEHIPSFILFSLVQKLSLFFKPEADGQRLIDASCSKLFNMRYLAVSLAKHFLKEKEEVLSWAKENPSVFIFGLKHFILFNIRGMKVDGVRYPVLFDDDEDDEYDCTGYLASIAKPGCTLAIPMRILEVFTIPTIYSDVAESLAKKTDTVFSIIFFHIIKFGYYDCLREVLKHRVTSDLTIPSMSPTPLACCIFSLIMEPLTFASSLSDRTLCHHMLLHLCDTFFCTPYSPQVDNFLLPAMAASTHSFSFSDLVSVISTHTHGDGSAAKVQKIASLNVPTFVLPLSQVALENKLDKKLKASPWLLCSILRIGKHHSSNLNATWTKAYLELLRRLLPCLRGTDNPPDDTESDEVDESEAGMECDRLQSMDNIRRECVRRFDSSNVTTCIRLSIQNQFDEESITCVCDICYKLMFELRVHIHKSRLLYALAYNKLFLRLSWNACTSMALQSVTGSGNQLISVLSNGLILSPTDIVRIVPLLSTFCSLFSYLLLTVQDADFHGDLQSAKSRMPFSLQEIVSMSLVLRNVCLGIIEIAHVQTVLPVREHYSKVLRRTGLGQGNSDDHETKLTIWTNAFKVVSTLVRQIYARDNRRRFCAHGHWLTADFSTRTDHMTWLFKFPELFVRRPFHAYSSLLKMKVGMMRTSGYNLSSHRAVRVRFREHARVCSSDDNYPPLSVSDVRKLIILTELPFVVKFVERVEILQQFMHEDMSQYNHGYHGIDHHPHIMIRRQYIYEDAFEKLSKLSTFDLKRKLKVTFQNAVGLEEAGVDGGGLFREFIALLLKSAVDPNRAFFQYTSNKQLYPNPQSSFLFSQYPHYTDHFYFIGCMLGKALLENMMLEIPFATFFFCKIISHKSSSLDIHHLHSLDPLIYKNLITLQDYEGDISDLGLDFTVVVNNFGESKVLELKPGGANIPVTQDNCIEYVYLMADYYLNKQIFQHCEAFRDGLAGMVKLDWLQMFSGPELQVLISGASVPVDLSDLRRNTHYSGGYSDSHTVINMFWDITSQFPEEKKRLLLRFVTACSRPPLLGFKDLNPMFCIHGAGQYEDRLPTASTCMNMLKLPEFSEYDTMRAKLLYAIEAESGFELS